jgi:tRNA(Ile)-lysidine synthase TilS/MesJ
MRRKNIINEVTKRVLSEKVRIKRISEAVEYDPEHPERMHPGLEGKLRSGEHLFGKSKSLPVGSDTQNYSEKLAGQRFKEIINKVKRYHGVRNITPNMMQMMFQIMGEISQIETRHKETLERLAVDIVSEEFDLPEQMLEATLTPPGSPLSNEPDEEEEEDDDSPQFEVPKQPKSAERMEE